MAETTVTKSQTETSYDEIPYDSLPFGQTHPSRLFTVATLFGLKPTPVQKCRVLELGCAAGGNLLPMADYLPNSEFVGVDLSAVQIQDGQANIQALGLTNLVLKQASILDIDEAYGHFDYIICHGVYSWVPNEVRNHILKICSDLLTPNGVAYISYNTYPGWHMRGMIRDMMRYHSARFANPKEKIQQSRALLDFLSQAVIKRQSNGIDQQLNAFGQAIEEVGRMLTTGKFDKEQMKTLLNQGQERLTQLQQLLDLSTVFQRMSQLQNQLEATEFPSADYLKEVSQVYTRFQELSNLMRTGSYAQLLRQETESLRQQADHYLYHEHLEEVNDPVYFHDFIEKATSHGLKYLGESRIGTMVTGNFGQDVDRTLRSIASDQFQAEQYMDFLRNRMFRESLLIQKSQEPNWQIQAEVMPQLHIASATSPIAPENVDLQSTDSIPYKTISGVIVNTNRPIMKAALRILNEAFPATVAFSTLVQKSRELLGGPSVKEDAQTLALGFVSSYISSDLVELHGMPIAFYREISERPMVIPFVRLMCSKTGMITNRRHEVVKLNKLDQYMIPLLDGQNDRAEIVKKLTTLCVNGTIPLTKQNQRLTDEAEIQEALNENYEVAMKNLARLGILMQ